MADRHPMTAACYKRLQEELFNLKTYERPKASKAIEIARAHGDLSENAEYHAAKEAQGLLEAKIRMMEERFGAAQVVDVSKLSGKKAVFGATVTLLDMDTDEKKVIAIVGEDEADIQKGRISYKSPLAKAVIGKEEGDVVQAKLPSGEKDYEIVAVKFVELA